MYLSEDLDRTLKRYIGKFVSIFTFGGHRFVGRLESLLDGGFRLSNAERLDDYDESNWYSAMRDIERQSQQHGNGRETIVLFPQVVCITCPDENLEPISDRQDCVSDDPRRSESLPKFVDESLQVDMYLGSELLTHLQNSGKSLLTSISDIRTALSNEFGFSFPGIRVHESSESDVKSCSMNWQGLNLGQMRFPIGSELLLHDGAEPSTGGTTLVHDPIWHAPAIWIADSQSAQWTDKGFPVLSLDETFFAFVQSTLRTHCSHFYTFEHTSNLISQLRSSSPSLVEEAVERSSSMSSLHTLLNRMIEDRCTIRPLNRILTEFGCPWEANDITDANVSRCRLAIARWLCNAFRNESDRIRTIQLPANIETRLASEKVNADQIQLIQQMRLIHRAADRRGPSCLVVDPLNHRPIIKKLAWLTPNLAVISSNEVESSGAFADSYAWSVDSVLAPSKKKSCEALSRLSNPRPK